MGLSELSALSSQTAISFHEEDLRKNHVDVVMAVDDETLEKYEAYNQFRYQNYLFTIEQNIEESRKIFMNVSSITPAEWILLVQLRIKTGATATPMMHVVDKDNFRFNPYHRPLVVELQTDEITSVKIEMRVLNKLYLDLPLFNEGELVLRFEDGVRLRVHSHILKLLSSYMDWYERNTTFDQSHDQEISVENVPSAAFRELLYQIYPTRRPIYANFRKLAIAATAYQCERVIMKLSRHVLTYSAKPLTFEDRLTAAIENKLEPAIRELAFSASRDGSWDYMVQQGFEPESFCGKKVYQDCVCPAVIAGRGAPLDATFLKETPVKFNFLKKPDADDNSTTTIIFVGTCFYVNSGLLAAYGKRNFSVNTAGDLIARYTNEFREECLKNGSVPGEVLLQLLAYMHPDGEIPHPTLLRAALIFAHDHGWTVVKENIEQELLLEPPMSLEEYVDKLKFAEKFNLDNMIRTNVQRAESSCKEYAKEMASKNMLDQFGDTIRLGIMDRMCSGWGLHPATNRLATRIESTFTYRKVNLQRGHPAPIGEGRACDTLASILSENAFGEPTEMVLVE